MIGQFESTKSYIKHARTYLELGEERAIPKLQRKSKYSASFRATSCPREIMFSPPEDGNELIIYQYIPCSDKRTSNCFNFVIVMGRIRKSSINNVVQWCKCKMVSPGGEGT